MSAHTKGPWDVAPYSDTDEVVSVVACYSEHETPDGKIKTAHWIAECDASLDFDSDREAELSANFANAHLIAAAPELLAALKAVVENCGPWHDRYCSCDDTCDCSAKPIHDAVNAAIAKAEGK